MDIFVTTAFSGVLIPVVLAIGIAVFWWYISQPAPIPDIEPTWWGHGESCEDNPTITPFKINISDEVIDDLRTRLKLQLAQTSPLEGTSFEYGFNTDFLKTLVGFWLHEYNWKKREAFLNSLPHYKTQVSGLQIHFIHVKPLDVPKGIEVLPLLLLHGWPGSIREFYDIIPLLTTPRKDGDFVFEVIAPSLPGYGFSEGAAKPGLGAIQVAVIFKKLMERLGFEQFYVQGGDWGAAIASCIATLYQESILGHHSTMCVVNTPLSNLKILINSLWPSLVVDEANRHKIYPITKAMSFILNETGYFHLQATKPDTLGIALRDSPVGLAAYILEKFSIWTDPSWQSLPDGGLTKKFSLTDLLDNIMIYWVTGSITTSMRLYRESFNKANFALRMDNIPTTVPTACAAFPKELLYYPAWVLRDKYVNLVRITNMERGGHFSAFEEPHLLADDIFSAIHLMRNYTLFFH